MFQQTNNPYQSAAGDAANQKFCTGTVRAYDPDKRLYTVDVLGYGEHQCKQVSTGLLRPYADRAKVVVATFSGSRWTIIGEVPQPLDGPEGRANSTEENLASSRGRVTGAADAEEMFFPNYRELDAAGEPEVPVFPGDARVENRASRNLVKSFLHIFKFGDIVLKAKSFCYIYLSRAKSTIVMRARDLQERFSGYRREVETPLLPDLPGIMAPNQTTVTESIWLNPLLMNLPANIIHRSGTLTGKSLYVNQGFESTYLGGFQHVDLVEQTFRRKSGKAYFLMGSLLPITSGTPLIPGANVLDLPVPTDVGTGISLQTPFSNLTMLDEIQTLRLQQGENTILMSPLGVVTTSGANAFTVNPAGVALSGGANVFTVNELGINIANGSAAVLVNDLGVNIVKGTSAVNVSEAGINLVNGTNVVAVNEVETTLVNGANKVTVSDAGINIAGTALNINIAGPVKINGATVDIKPLPDGL